MGALILKWLKSVFFQNWKLVAGAFGALVIYAKGRSDKKKQEEIKTLKKDLKMSEDIRNVEINTDRDSSLKRLSDGGFVRKD